MKKKLSAFFIGMLILSQAFAQCGRKDVGSHTCDLKSNITTVKYMGASPGKGTVGKKTQVVIEATNTGLCPWMTNYVYMRVTVVGIPSGISLGSYQRDELVPDNDIKVNDDIVSRKSETFIYDIDLTEEAKTGFPPGEYTLKFQLVCKGKVFGEVLTEEFIVVDPNRVSGPCILNAKFEDGMQIPAKVMAGKKYPVLVSVTNTSKCTWESPKNKIELRIVCKSWPTGADKNAIDPMIPDRPLLPESRTEIRHEQGTTFGYDLVGGPIPGPYTFEFQLTDNGKAFGPKSLKTVEVIGDPKRCDMKAYIQVTGVPSVMKYNEDYPIVVRIQNTGTCPWVAASKVVIKCHISTKPEGSPALPGLLPDGGVYPVGNNVIEVGKFFELRYKLKGPYLHGAYELTWEIFKDGSNTGIKEEKPFKVVIPK